MARNYQPFVKNKQSAGWATGTKKEGATIIKPNNPAFSPYGKEVNKPYYQEGWEAGGLTIRAYFAAFAMQGLIASGSQLANKFDGAARQYLAETSFLIADAMIEEQNKNGR